MGFELPEEFDKNAFMGRHVRETMTKIIKKYHRLLDYEPLLELTDFDFEADVEVIYDGLKTTLEENPLPPEAEWLLLCLNDENDPMDITLYGAKSFEGLLREPFLYPDEDQEVGEISLEFFQAVLDLQHELGFDEDAELEALGDDEEYYSDEDDDYGDYESGYDEGEEEFERRQAIDDALTFDLNLLFLAAAISFICKDPDTDHDFLLEGRDTLHIAMMAHSGDPIKVGTLSHSGWTPQV